MLAFENVSKSFHGEPLLEEVSFKLNRGEKCGLVGRNGSGKTTLLKMVTKEEIPDTGSIALPKHYNIGYLTQHLKFTKKTVREEAALALPQGEEELLYKAEKILFGLGFKEENLEQDPALFSGGYQLRIHLAKVLVSEPDCLLLDEPTNYLDIVSIRWFIRFLQGWKGEALLISHDRDFMDSVITHTVGIHRNKVRKLEGGTEKFYSQLLQEEYIQEKTRLNQEKKREHLESFIERFGAKASKATQAQARAKALDKMPVLEELAALHNLDFTFPYSTNPSASPLIKAEDLSFSYDTHPLIQHLSLTIEKKDRIACIGKNGRGKSTLLRLLAQDIEPSIGTLKTNPHLRVGFFGQTNIDRLKPKLTIEEEIGSALPQLTTGEVRRICGVMLFSGEKAKKKIEVLSGGEKSRVLLGKILVSRTNLLLLDEPTNHLDMESIEALVSALEVYEGAVIIVTHSELILKAIPHKFILCKSSGQQMFTGDYASFLEKVGWEEEVKKERKPKGVQPSKKVEKIEREILKLEREVKELLDRLTEASQVGDFEKCASLQATVEKKKEEIELLFRELE